MYSARSAQHLAGVGVAHDRAVGRRARGCPATRRPPRRSSRSAQPRGPTRRCARGCAGTPRSAAPRPRRRRGAGRSPRCSAPGGSRCSAAACSSAAPMPPCWAADLLVERHQVGVELGRPGCRAAACSLATSASISAVAVSRRGRQLGRLGRRPPPAAPVSSACRLCDRLQPLHDLQHDVLEVGLAPAEGRDLVLEALQLLGRGDLAGVEPLLVAGGAGPDLVDVPLGLAQLARDVALLGLGADQVVAQLGQPASPARQRRVLGQRARRCASWSMRASRAWTSSRRSWSVAAAFSAGSWGRRC